MECNLLFNHKRRKIDNLNNARFSHNSTHGVVGHGSTVDSNILDLTNIFSYYVPPKLVLISMGVY